MSDPAHPRGGGHRVLVAAIAALTVAGLVLVGIALTRQVGDPPAPAAQPTATQAQDDAPPPPPPSDAGSDDRTDGPGDEAVQALSASAPARLRVPDLGVDRAPIDLDLNDDGTMEVPDDGADVGWYTPSPTPGEIGPTVLAGHVTRSSEPAVFFELGGMQPGQRAEVTREDGTTVVYEVTKVEQYPKDDFPTLQVYGNTDGPELRLITCGGEIDSATGHFDENVVVYATMVDVVEA